MYRQKILDDYKLRKMEKLEKELCFTRGSNRRSHSLPPFIRTKSQVSFGSVCQSYLSTSWWVRCAEARRTSRQRECCMRWALILSFAFLKFGFRKWKSIRRIAGKCDVMPHMTSNSFHNQMVILPINWRVALALPCVNFSTIVSISLCFCSLLYNTKWHILYINSITIAHVANVITALPVEFKPIFHSFWWRFIPFRRGVPVTTPVKHKFIGVCFEVFESDSNCDEISVEFCYQKYIPNFWQRFLHNEVRDRIFALQTLPALQASLFESAFKVSLRFSKNPFPRSSMRYSFFSAERLLKCSI